MKKLAGAVTVLSVVTLLPVIIRGAGATVSLLWSLLSMLAMLALLLEDEHPVAARVARYISFATWPIRVVIDETSRLSLLWLRPKRWSSVASMGLLWEQHPERITAQLKRAPREYLQYCTTAASPPGFSHAVALELASGEWDETAETAAWAALSSCSDPDLLADGMDRLIAWMPAERSGDLSHTFAPVALQRNAGVQLSHVVKLGLTVRNAGWYVLEHVERAQGRNLVAEEYPGVYGCETVVELGRALAGEPGVVLPLARELTLGEMCSWLDAHDGRREGFVPVLAAVLDEEERCSGDHDACVRAAVGRVDALGDLAMVARLLAAGAVGSVEDLDAAGAAIA